MKSFLLFAALPVALGLALASCSNYSGYKDKKYWTYYKDFGTGESWKNYRNAWSSVNVSNPASEQRNLKIYNFKENEKVASLGAFLGIKELIYSKLSPKLEFYLEDLNPKILHPQVFNDLSEKVNTIYPQRPGTTFHLVIGDPKKTMLPDDYFDKILIEKTFHEFEFKDDMLADIRTKLKADGRLYITENMYFLSGPFKCREIKGPVLNHEQLVQLLAKHHFDLVTKYDTPDDPFLFHCWEFKKVPFEDEP